MDRSRTWGDALRLDRRVYLLGSAGLVRSVGRSATFVFLPLVLAHVYHLSYLTIGALIATIVPVSTLAFLVGGNLSDRRGRRPFAVYPSFASAVVLTLLWLYLDLGVAVVMVLWGANALLGGLTRPAQSAMIGDVTRPEQAVTAFGVQRVFNNVGFAISPAIGGFLAAYVGLSALFLFAALTSLVEGAILVPFLRETHAGGSGAKEPASTNLAAPFRDRPFVWLLVASAGLALLMSQFGTPLALFLGSVRSVPYTEFGLVYSLNGALVVLLQLPIARLVGRRYSQLSWMSLGTLTYGVSFLVFDAAGSFPGYLGAMGILTVGEDLVSPTQQSLVSSAAGGPERRGSYFGAFNATNNISQVVAPVVGTLLLGLGPSGPEILWVGMFVASLAVALGFYRLHARSRGRGNGGNRPGSESEGPRGQVPAHGGQADHRGPPGEAPGPTTASGTPVL